MDKKEALLKRHIKPKRLTIEQWNINHINRQLAAVKETIDERQIKDPKEASGYLFSLRTEYIKGIIKEKVLTRKFIKKYWSREYDDITARMPFGWMYENKEIEKMLNNHKPLIPILNVLQSISDKVKGNDAELERLSKGTKHISIRPKRIDKKLLKNKAGETLLFRSDWPVSAMITNRVFYKEISDITEYSTKTVRRYVKALVGIKALKVVNTIRSNTPVISFGYYVRTRVGIRHVNHMTKDNFEKVLEKGFYVGK